MPNLYANSGVDLDLIFFDGTGANTTGIIDDTGQDIGYKYSAGSVGMDLGFVASSGQDVGRILGGEVAEIWRSREVIKSDSEKLIWKRYYESSESAVAASSAWHLVTMFKNTSSDWEKVSNTTESQWIGLHGGWLGHFRYYGRISAYAFRVVAMDTEGSVDISLGAPSSNDGNVWITEIRSPNAYTKTFVVCGLGGENLTDSDSDSEDDPDPIYSYRTLTITTKVRGIATRTYSVRFIY